ncbi:MAG: sortase [Chloroflexi bacterium]|nr:sortase [Chloroflexota bacterium]
MQAGDSGTRTEPQHQRRFGLILGLTLVTIGLLLLSGVGAYYGLGWYSSTQLSRLNASFDGPVSLPSTPTTASSIGTVHGAIMPDGSFKSAQVVTDLASFFGPEATAQTEGNYAAIAYPSKAPAEGSEIAAKGSAFPVSSYASIYPASQMHPKYWHQPMWAGTDVYSPVDTSQTAGFQPVSALDLPQKGTSSNAVRIRIPIIGVDSVINDLAIVDLGDSRAYETPDNVVGHIPDTANPGESGNGWFFGHLESFVRGEGSVFNKLHEVADYITNGDPVYISILNDDGEYLYQVVSSRVIHQSELRIRDTDDSTITLVTCANRPFYDQRQLVTAKLVGFKPFDTLN